MISDLACGNLKKMIASWGADRTIAHLREALQKKYLRPEDFSIRDLFAGLVEGGEKIVNRRRLHESIHTVDSSDFVKITGSILSQKVIENYDNPGFVWRDLVTIVPTTNILGERIAAVGRIGDAAQSIKEGTLYPSVSFGSHYIDTPPLKKSGFIVPVTREAIISDKTGMILNNAAEVGLWLGVRQEKEVLDVVVGNVNNYNRNGVSSNTFLTSGAYVNDLTGNKLLSWANVEKAEVQFSKMKDPSTGEPMVLAPPFVILVPPSLKLTALRILNATSVWQVDNQTNAETIRTESPSPLRATDYKVLSGPFVFTQTNSETKWFIGNPKRAFFMMQAWDVEVEETSRNDEASFVQDVEFRFKVSKMDAVQVVEPRFWIRNDA